MSQNYLLHKYLQFYLLIEDTTGSVHYHWQTLSDGIWRITYNNGNRAFLLRHNALGIGRELFGKQILVGTFLT